jgi:hypothetical protein
MTTKKFFSPIVGAIFRPPSAFVMSRLPMGQELEVRRQPDNQYDSNACQVLLHGFNLQALPEIFGECLSDALPDDLPAGRNIWNLSALTDPLFLGFIAAKTGEATRLSGYLDERGQLSINGKLTLTLQGAPAIELELEDN